MAPRALRARARRVICVSHRDAVAHSGVTLRDLPSPGPSVGTYPCDLQAVRREKFRVRNPCSYGPFNSQAPQTFPGFWGSWEYRKIPLIYLFISLLLPFLPIMAL